MTVLVTGATGAVGRHVVAGLRQLGVPVRALTRDPARAALPDDVQVVAGDLTGALPAGVFDGVRRAFVFPADGGVAKFVEQAAAAGVEHLVVLSSLAVDGRYARDADSPSGRHHRAVEQTVRGSGVPFTFLRPGTFANNLLAWAGELRGGDVVHGPYAASRQAPIHEADVADVAVRALTDDGHRGAIHALSGPEALSRTEQLATIGTAIGRELHYREIPPEAFRAAVSAYLPDEIITMVLGHWRDTLTEPDPVLPAVRQVTGSPGRSVAQWARDHRADFGA
jgi:uncharacterized protein YbjT (DUF2867 family)